MLCTVEVGKSSIKYFHVIFCLYIYVLLTGKMVDIKMTICTVWFSCEDLNKKSVYPREVTGNRWRNWFHPSLELGLRTSKFIAVTRTSVACKNIVDSKATNSVTSTFLAWVRAHESYITGVLFPAYCTSPCGRLFCPSSYNCSHMWDIPISVNLVSFLCLLSLANVICLLSFVTFVYFLSLLSLPHLFSRKYLIRG